MSDHPENRRPMHDLLQAYARKRRADAGGPAEMHPGMRNRLLAEVRKQKSHPAVRSGSWFSRLGLRLPRLAFALGLLVVLAVGLGVVFWNEHSSSSRELAKQDLQAPAEPALRDEDKQFETPSKETALNFGSHAPAPSPVAPEASSPVVPQTPSPALRPYQQPAVNQEAKALNVRVLQALDSSPGTGVLSAFELEQTGAYLRLIDGDGSVYEGQVLPGTEAIVTLAGTEKEVTPVQLELRTDLQTVQAFNAAQTRPVTQSLAGVSSPVWNFRVRGTNRTLQTPVELEGLLLAGSEVPAQAARGLRLEPQPDAPRRQRVATTASHVRFSRAKPSAQGDMMTNAAVGQLSLRTATNAAAVQRIQGTLRIGGTNVSQLDAYRANGN